MWTLARLILNRARWIREYNRRRFDRIDRQLVIIREAVVGDSGAQARVDAMERKLEEASNALDSLQK